MTPSDILEATTGQRNALCLELFYVHANQHSEIYSMQGVMYGYDVWFYVQTWEESLPDVWVCLNQVSFNNPERVRLVLFKSCIASYSNWTVSCGTLTDHCSEEEFTMAALRMLLQ